MGKVEAGYFFDFIDGRDVRSNFIGGSICGDDESDHVKIAFRIVEDNFEKGIRYFDGRLAQISFVVIKNRTAKNGGGCR